MVKPVGVPGRLQVVAVAEVLCALSPAMLVTVTL